MGATVAAARRATRRVRQQGLRFTGPRRRDPPEDTEARNLLSEPQSLLAQVREDWVTHNRRTMLPGFQAVAVHRLGTWGHGQPPPVRQLVRLLYKVLNNLLIRNVYGIELYDTTVVGRRLLIGHHAGVVLGAEVIGDDVLVRQQVTLGATGDHGSGPVIGNRVELGAGAAVIGPVSVGDGAKIGPGAVVMVDVPAGGFAAAPTARVLRLPAKDDA